MKRLSSERGLALPELLVAISLAIVVMGAGVVTLAAFSKQRQRVTSQSNMQDSARVTLDRLAEQLRNAKPSSNGAHPIERSSAYDIVFLAPVQSASLTNNPAGLAHFRYCVDSSSPTDEALWLQSAPYDSNSQPSPPSTSDCPSASWPNQQIVARQLINQYRSPAVPFFTTTTDSSGIITDVGIDAYVDTNPTADPPATELRSSVTLRNLNRAPTASISCQASTNGHALCDASGSADPEGRSLTYAWSMDGNPLTETTYRLDQGGLASGSTHAFTVTVTDPEGLSSSASQSMTLP